MSDDTVPVGRYIAALEENIRLLEQLVELKRRTIEFLEQAAVRNEAAIANLERQLGEWVAPEDRAARRLWLIEHFMGGLE